MVNSKLNNDKFLLTYSEQAKGTLLCQIGCHGCCGAALPRYYRNLNVYYKLYIFKSSENFIIFCQGGNLRAYHACCLWSSSHEQVRTSLIKYCDDASMAQRNLFQRTLT